MLIFNWYNSLPADLQKIMQDGAWLYTDTQDKLRADSSDDYKKMIIDGGVKVYMPTDAELKMFSEKCKPVYDYYINEKKYFTKAELDEVEISTWLPSILIK